MRNIQVLVSFKPAVSVHSQNINHKNKAQNRHEDRNFPPQNMPSNVFKAYSLPKITFGNGIPVPAKLPELYSVVFQINSHLAKVHQKVLTKCAEKGWTNDSPELPKWLTSEFKKDHGTSWDADFDPQGKTEEECDNAHALAVYTCGIMERQIIRAILKVAPASKQPELTEYGDMLKRLSNVYKCKHNLHPDKPFYLKIADELSERSAENYGVASQEPTYWQANFHRLHLGSLKHVLFEPTKKQFVGKRALPVYFKEKDQRMGYAEEKLKLCFALNQIQDGVHNSYARCILEDLIELYYKKGDEQSKKMYLDYAKQVVPVVQEPELWYREQFEKNRPSKKS